MKKRHGHQESNISVLGYHPEHGNKFMIWSLHPHTSTWHPTPSMWSHWRCWSNGSVLLTTGNYCRWIKECQHPFRRNLRNLFPSPRSDSPAFPSAIQAQEQSDKLKCLECSRTHSVQLTSRSEMIAGTELARVLKELEQEYNSREENKHQHHHDEA